MLESLHCLRAVLVRALLLFGIAQIVAPGDAAAYGAPREAAALSEASLNVGSGTDADEDVPSSDEELDGDDVAEIEVDEVDARRRLTIRLALPSPDLPNGFWEELVRTRFEDRRLSRPPTCVG